MIEAQNHKSVYTQIIYFIVLMIGIFALGITTLHAQGFAEDFSDTNRLNYTLTTSGSANTPIPPANSRAPVLSGVFIRPSNNSGVRTRFQRLNVHSDTNLLEARVILNSDIRNGIGTIGARIQLRVYNDTADGGPGYAETGAGSDEGDVRILLEYRTSGNRTPTVRLRGQRFSNGGFSDIANFFNLDGGLTAGGITLRNVDASVGQEHTMLVDVDLQNRRITYGFDSVRQTTTFNATQIFEPNRFRQGIETQVFEDESDGAQKDIRATVTVNGIRTTRFDNDFTRQPPSLRYTFPDTEVPASTVQLIDSRVRLSTQRSRQASRTLSTNLFLENNVVEHTDYHEVTMTLSSSSNATRGRDVEVRHGGTFYNDLPNGSDGSIEGDMNALIALQLSNDGSTNAIYCLVRFNNATGSNLTVSCNDFDNNFVPNVDTPYQAIISLDRNARTLQFTLNNGNANVQRTLNIDTAIGDPSSSTRFISSYLPQGQVGQVVGFFDNLRTSANAVPQVEVFPDLPPIPAPTQPPVVVTPPTPAPTQPPVVNTPPVPAPTQPPVVITPPLPAPTQPPVVVTSPIPLEQPVTIPPLTRPPIENSQAGNTISGQTFNPPAGPIGSSGDGCSISTSNSATTDPSLLLMFTASLGICCWRRRKSVA